VDIFLAGAGTPHYIEKCTKQNLYISKKLPSRILVQRQ
jgi:hypothetical protein